MRWNRPKQAPRMDLDPNIKPSDVQRFIEDRNQARDAWEFLRKLGTSNVYLPAGWIAAGHRDFNVWVPYAMFGLKAQTRYTLKEWCAAWLSAHDASREILPNRESALPN